jgi:hypothetical protein
MRGGQIEGGSVMLSFAGGAFFAGVAGTTQATGLGTHMIYGSGKGLNAGLLGGAFHVTVVH